MRCRICGYRCKDQEIARMASHYRKKHPRAMAKKRKHEDTRSDSQLVYRILKKEGLI